MLKLLSQHPDWNLNERWYQLRMLDLAANNDQHEVVEFLLAQPTIDVNGVDGNGKTALMFAASQRNYTILAMLLAHPNIDPKLTDCDGKTWKTYLKQSSVRVQQN